MASPATFFQKLAARARVFKTLLLLAANISYWLHDINVRKGHLARSTAKMRMWRKNAPVHISELYERVSRRAGVGGGWVCLWFCPIKFLHPHQSIFAQRFSRKIDQNINVKKKQNTTRKCSRRGMWTRALRGMWTRARRGMWTRARTDQKIRLIDVFTVSIC